MLRTVARSPGWLAQPRQLCMEKNLTVSNCVGTVFFNGLCGRTPLRRRRASKISLLTELKQNISECFISINIALLPERGIGRTDDLFAGAPHRSRRFLPAVASPIFK